MNLHIPKVRIITPEPDHLGGTLNIFTKLTIDGEEWAVLGYSIDGSHTDRMQRVTLTFLADVTVRHPDAR